MSEASTQEEAHNLVTPLWHNAYWVRNSLEQWQAINKHAQIIKGKHEHFWGLTQKTALDHAIICLARMYDDNSQHKVHSVYEVIKFLESQLIFEMTRSFSFIATELKLDFLSNKKNALLFKEADNFAKDKVKLLNMIRASQPSRKKGSPLAKVLAYRSKFVAHQEILTLVDAQSFSELPKLEELYELNNWANNLSCLVLSMFIPNTYYEKEGTPSAFMATSNVVRKYLNITFDDPDKTPQENSRDQREFYTRS